MSDLDERLKDIVAALMFGSGGDNDAVELHARQIEQAFTDAGWIDGTEMAEYVAQHSVNVHVHRDAFVGPDSIVSAGIEQTETEIEYDKPPKQRFGRPIDFMTGQEWYDRFKNLSDSSSGREIGQTPKGFAEQLAREAAGIE